MVYRLIHRLHWLPALFYILGISETPFSSSPINIITHESPTISTFKHVHLIEDTEINVVGHSSRQTIAILDYLSTRVSIYPHFDHRTLKYLLKE